MLTSLPGPIPTHEIYEDPSLFRISSEKSHRTSLSGSMRALDVLQWQSNTSSVQATPRPRGPALTPKNHIHENIRRLRQYQRLNRQRNGVNSTGTSVVMTRPNQRHIQQTPRPQCTGSSCVGHNERRSSFPLNCSDMGSGVGDHGASTIHRPREMQYKKQFHSTATDTETDESSGYVPGKCTPLSAVYTRQVSETPKKCQATQCSTQKSIMHVSQGVQVYPSDSKESIGVPRSKSSERLRPRRKKSVSRASSAEPKKREFMRAHAKTAADDWNLQMLGTMPLTQTNSTPKPEQLSVPKASSAKSVQLIRRDINFVRANAHLAGRLRTPLMTKRTTPSWHRRMSTSSHTSSYDISQSRSTAGGSTVGAGKWPERRLPVGGIPNYIVEMRRKAAEAHKRELANRPDPDQPPGYQLMPDNERVETLRLLQKAHTELTDEWSRLPVRSDTVRLVTRRTELEQRLTELEHAIGIFDKPKVYIKPD